MLHTAHEPSRNHSASRIANEEWLSLVLAAARAGLWDVDLVSQRATWSPEMYALFGRDPSLGPPTPDDVRELIHPADVERAERSVTDILSGQSLDIEFRVQRADGSIVWLNSIGYVEYDEQGRPARMLGITRDITARKQAEEARHESEQFLRRVTEITPALIVVYDQNEARTIYSNRNIAEMLGYEAGTIGDIDAFAERTMHPEDLAAQTAIRARYRNLVSNETLDFECRFLHADGTWRSLQTRATVFARNSDGSVRQILASAIDVTERRRAEEELRRLNTELEQRVATRTFELSSANRKLEAANRELEAFAYSVSHDLRAPLRAIDGFSRLLLEDFGAQLPPEAHGHVDRVHTAAQRMGDLIEALLALSRTTRGELELLCVDLSELARAVISELRRADPGRAVEFECAAEAKATGDARLLRIALENLLGNAWKFTAGQPHARIEFGVYEESGQQVFFVRDNGAGFDMNRAATKLFKPFQRFHKTEEFAGTGIGLATVQRIIAHHGGRICAQSAPGKGATFHFALAACPVA